MELTDALMAELRAGIDRRYGPGIFQYHGRSKARIFRFGLFRLAAALFHWTMGFARTGPRPAAGKGLGLYTTRNQQIALDRLKQGLRPELCNIPLYRIDSRLSLKMVGLVAAALVLYPFAFPFARNPHSLHDQLLLGAKLKALLSGLMRLQPEVIVVSNDHQGEVFWLSFAWARLGREVHYVQHGTVTPDFPHNYFSACYLRDPQTAALYRTELCRRADVRVVTVPELADETGGAPSSARPFVLVALSHRYHWRETRRVLVLLSRLVPHGTEIRLRFHPSDRFAGLKFLMSTFGLKSVRMDRGHRPFLAIYREAVLTISARSSVLAEAAATGRQTIIWLKSLGLPDDYYRLAGRIPALDDTKALAEFLRTAGVSYLASLNEAASG